MDLGRRCCRPSTGGYGGRIFGESEMKEIPPTSWEPMERMRSDSVYFKEERLREIREQAQRDGQVPAKGIRPQGSPFPIASPATGYYAIPLLKPPQWTWEIPVYFFVGGGAGAAAMIAAAAEWSGQKNGMVRDA